MKFPVTDAKTSELASQMARYGIEEKDLEESFIRGSGSGGQKINKTASCVVLKHVPSGVQVKSQESRSQALNRFHARRLLVKEFQRKVEGRLSPEAEKADKIRKQKKRRSRRSQKKRSSS